MLRFVILALATWRLTIMLTDQEGPWHLFRRIREAVGIIHDDEGPVGYPETMAAQAFACPRCLSVWIAPIVIVLAWLAPPVVWALGLSGAVSLLESWVEQHDHEPSDHTDTPST